MVNTANKDINTTKSEENNFNLFDLVDLKGVQKDLSLGIAKAGKEQTKLELNDPEIKVIGMAETNKQLAKIWEYSYTSIMFRVGIIPCLGKVRFFKQNAQ